MKLARTPLLVFLASVLVLSLNLSIPGTEDDSNGDRMLPGGFTILQGPPENPREMFAAMGIQAGDFSYFHDHRPLSNSEEEPLLRILFRLPDFSPADIQRWATPLATWDAIFRSPESARVCFFRVHGRADKVERHRLAPEQAKKWGFGEYYTIDIESDGQRFLAVVRDIPRAWQTLVDRGQPIDDHVSLRGLFLKLATSPFAPAIVPRDAPLPGTTTGEDASRTDPSAPAASEVAAGAAGSDAQGRSWPLLVAQRIAWHPSRVSAELGTNAGQVVLGTLGMDVGLFDQLAHRKRLGMEDRECFYQLLAAVGRPAPPDLARQARRRFNLAKMIERPGTEVGNFYSINGTARRITRILVEDPEIRARFSIDHYFEVEVFVSLDRPVRFVAESGGAGSDRIFSEYPFVVCVRHLPGSLQPGEQLNQPVQASAFFFKTWAYHTPFMSGSEPAESPANDAPGTPQATQSHAVRGLQLSPLLIGSSLALQPSQAPDSSMIATLLASLLLGGILLTAGVAWWFAAGDRGFTRRARQRAPDRSVWDSLANSPPAAVVDDDPESATDRSDPDKAN